MVPFIPTELVPEQGVNHVAKLILVGLMPSAPSLRTASGAKAHRVLRFDRIDSVPDG